MPLPARYPFLDLIVCWFVLLCYYLLCLLLVGGVRLWVVHHREIPESLTGLALVLVCQGPGHPPACHCSHWSGQVSGYHVIDDCFLSHAFVLSLPL